MMFQKLSTTVLLATVVAMPLTADAYMSPEDVMNDENMTTQFFAPPPSRRTIQDVLRRQQELSALRREAELALVKPQPAAEAEVVATEPEPASSGNDIDKLIQLIQLLQNEDGHSAAPDEEGTDSGLSITDERLLERIHARQEAASRQAMIQALLGEDTTMHSGAPLSDTGPMSYVAVALMGLAVCETWRRVRKAEKLIIEN